MSNKVHRLYLFGSFRLDAASRVLTRAGSVVTMAPKTFDLLTLLVENQGRLLDKPELMTALWPGTNVEEANLSFQISILRKALHEDGGDFIETVPKHGYRFTREVHQAELQALPPSTLPGNSRWDAFTRIRLIAALLTFAVLAGAAYLVREKFAKSSIATQPRITRLTSYPGSELTPSFSPEGSQIAFAWNGGRTGDFDIYVKVAGEGEPFRLTSNPADEFSPAWSPDGRSIAFIRLGEADTAAIFVKPSLGGAERKLTDIFAPSSSMRVMQRLSWSPDGKWLAVGGSLEPREQAGVRIISLLDGTARPLTVPSLQTGIDLLPAFDPRGRRLAFLRWGPVGEGELYVLNLNSDYSPAAAPFRITSDRLTIRGVAWTPDGERLIYSTGGLLAQRSLKEVPLTSGGRVNTSPKTLLFGEGAFSLSMSRNGSLVYSRENRDTNIWRLNLETSSVPPTRIIASTLDDHTPDYSPDGKHIAFASTRSGSLEIWMAGSDGANPVRMTHMNWPATSNPRWSPDGKTILFQSSKAGASDLYALDPATSAVSQLTTDPSDKVQGSWSRDGKYIYFSSSKSGTYQIWRMPFAGGPAVKITGEGGRFAQEAMDGRTLYIANGRTIWSMPSTGGPVSKVVDGLSYAINFAVADRGLYFMAEGATSGSSTLRFYDFSTRATRNLLEISRRWWFGVGISPDQKWLLYSIRDQDDTDLVLVEPG